MNLSTHIKPKTAYFASAAIAILLALGTILAPASGAASSVTSVTPAEGIVTLSPSGTFVMTITVDNDGDNPWAIEVDHSIVDHPDYDSSIFEVPEFTIYANETDPWSDGSVPGTIAGDTVLANYGASATFDSATTTWQLDLGAEITEYVINEQNGSLSFYLALRDDTGNYLWGDMNPPTSENTFVFSLEYADEDEEEPVIPGVPVTGTTSNSLPTLVAAGVAVLAVTSAAVAVRVYARRS